MSKELETNYSNISTERLFKDLQKDEILVSTEEKEKIRDELESREPFKSIMEYAYELQNQIDRNEKEIKALKLKLKSHKHVEGRVVVEIEI